MRSQNERIVILLIVAVPAVVSALSGLNTVFGFYSTISLSTAILSAVLALVVAAFLPPFLKTQWPAGETPPSPSSLRRASILLGIAIFGAVSLAGMTVLARWSGANGERTT